MGNGDFKPVRIRLITGKTELLPGMHIVKKLDIAVCFGSDRFQVWKGVGIDDFQWEASLGIASSSNCLCLH